MGILPHYYFPRKDETLHQERRVQVNTLKREHFNSILFHKFGSANKAAYLSISSMVVVKLFAILVKIVVFQTVAFHSLRKSSAVLHVGREDERVEVRVNSCLQDGKLSLKTDEPQIG